MIKKLAVSSFLTLTYATQSFASGDEHAPMHHDAGHAESSGGLPQLDPSSFTGQTFWLIIFFVIVYLIFSRKSLPDISRTVENRAERIKNDLDSADRLKNEVTSVQDTYEESLKKAREESSLLFQKIEDDLKVKSEDNTKKFQDYSADKIAELEENINKARDAAMEDMSEIAVDVATDAAEKIIGVRADAKSARAVVNSLNKAA
ncbi:MAG: hypothetical protein COB14_06905 [Alphaproteobacteria bacterium]|nr:MAG: hypothetical protein COB14_06905 [Alphaproteobacteria bacterium]